MNRRGFLAAGGAGAAIGVAGLLGDLVSRPAPSGADDRSPNVDGSELELAPGEEGTLRITAEGIHRLTFLELPDPESIAVGAGRSDVSPAPDTILESYPPIYTWSSTTTVEMTTTVRVESDAEPGEYRYAIHAARGSGSDDGVSTTEEFSITVVDR